MGAAPGNRAVDGYDADLSARRYAEVGVDEVHVMPFTPDPVAFVDRLGDHVVPRISPLWPALTGVSGRIFRLLERYPNRRAAYGVDPAHMAARRERFTIWRW